MTFKNHVVPFFSIIQSFEQSTMTFLCPTCGKTFLSKEKLRFHMQLHSEQIYTCHICDETCIGNKKFSNHLRIQCSSIFCQLLYQLSTIRSLRNLHQLCVAETLCDFQSVLFDFQNLLQRTTRLRLFPMMPSTITLMKIHRFFPPPSSLSSSLYSI